MNKFISVVSTLIVCSTTAWAASYWGAELRTRDAYVYGRFETRMKPPRTSGMLASFFTYHDFTPSTAWNEIDFEILGRYDHDVQLSSIGPGQKTRNSHQYVAFDTHEDFHNYAFEWTPDYIAWFIDDKEVYRQEQEHIQQFKHPQMIMMNIWSPEWEPWSGAWNDVTLPVFAYYDWVRYSAYTPGTGNYGTGNNFTLLWHDDFNTWNEARWEKATHTWGGNRTTFKTENVVFKDGIMILCLTKDANLGYLDKTAPSVLWTRGYADSVWVHFSEDVEATSASTKTNYVISGVTVQQARVWPDRRTVTLHTSPLTPAKNYNLVVLNVKDLWTPANRVLGQVVPITRVGSLSLPIKINIGGSAWRDYLPDQVWTPTLEYGHQDGYIGTWPAETQIANTSEDSLYVSELHELVEYRVRLRNGRYNATLKMAENQFKEAGQRLYDVYVQDKKVVDKLDLFKERGAQAAKEVKVNDVEVRDGLLIIHFTNLWNFSLVNALVIESSTTPVRQTLNNEATMPFRLLQNYPNPFNAATTISYDVVQDGRAVVEIFDQLGRRVELLHDGWIEAGHHDLHWQANVPSGVYFCRLAFTAGSKHFEVKRKMAFIK
jgi:hypothetical protein